MRHETAPSNQRLRRRERLRGRRTFARVFARRCSAGNASLVVYALPNDLDQARLGTIVSRKLGNAVARARVRRTIREFFRKAKAEIPAGYDYACIAKPTGDKEWVLTRKETVRVFARAVRKTSEIHRV